MLIGGLVLTIVGCGQKHTETAAANSPAANTTPVIHPDIWPQPAQPKIDDSAIQGRLEELLKSLSLEEKVGQIIQADLGSVTPQDVREYRLGSILVGGNSGPGGDDLAPAPKWLEAADAFYEASMDTTGGKHAIPIIWGVDAVHGHNNIIGATLFPHNIALGATRDPELIQQIGAVTAQELRVTGQGWTFAPTIAVVQDIHWGRSYESYSENPEIFPAYAAAMVTGLQGTPGSPDWLRGNHVIATAKHYLGDGGTKGGRDQGDNQYSEEDLRDIHAAGYPAAITAGVQVVMASFSSWHGQKLHGSRALLTDVLKGRMGFQGFVVGDWNAHGQVPGCTNTSCAAAINAGLDMFMAPDSWKDLYKSTLEQVKSGEIPEARLDDAVRRILLVKLRSGVFEAGKPSTRKPAGNYALLGSPEHRAVARRAVRESLVLLKNQNHLLPLSPKTKVLVAGDGADNISKQNGGWTLSWQGSGLPNSLFPHAESIYAGIRAAVSAAGGTATLSPSGKYTTKPDVAIVVFGEDPYAEFQGDIATLEYKPGNKSDLELLRKLKAAGIPVVSVFLSGRPLWTNPQINASDAFVAAWLPGSEGGGIADVLFAKPNGSLNHDFHGKLSFSWPRTTQQTKANPGDEPPLFAYGFGLTYEDDGNLAPLPEEVAAAVDPNQSTRLYFAGGKTQQGWTLTAQEGTAAAQPLTNAVGASSSGALTVSATDYKAQEDARLATWSGTASATLAITGDPIDIQRESNGQLSVVFDYRVDAAPQANVSLGVRCGENCGGEMPIGDALRKAPQGQWQQMKVLLQCFEKRGANMRSVSTPFAITSAGALKLGIANVHLDSGLADAITCN
jgi:beta-glucosidase